LREQAAQQGNTSWIMGTVGSNVSGVVPQLPAAGFNDRRYEATATTTATGISPQLITTKQRQRNNDGGIPSAHPDHRRKQ
jgi:hypothetical protein